MGERLDRPFFVRPARVVAVALLGKRLVRLVNGRRLSGLIVETEAYCDAPGQHDLACHGDRANNGRPTGRTAVMFGPAGFAYVYFTYGVHWMLNIVTGAEGEANAVLLRALEPVEGLDVMAELRGRSSAQLTNGPARLAQALAIDKTVNGHDLCAPDSQLWLEDAPSIPETDVLTGPRIGLGKTPEPWFSMPWRYWLRGNPFVSKRRLEIGD
jgi:DNA-3-methyladenine glycosylase